jgi:hypothetical protein
MVGREHVQLPRLRLLRRFTPRNDMRGGDPSFGACRRRAGEQECKTKPIPRGWDSCEVICSKRVMEVAVGSPDTQNKANFPGRDSGPPGREFFALGPLVYRCAPHTGGQGGLDRARRWLQSGKLTDGQACKTKPICRGRETVLSGGRQKDYGVKERSAAWRKQSQSVPAHSVPVRAYAGRLVPAICWAAACQRRPDSGMLGHRSAETGVGA